MPGLSVARRQAKEFDSAEGLSSDPLCPKPRLASQAHLQLERPVTAAWQPPWHAHTHACAALAVSPAALGAGPSTARSVKAGCEDRWMACLLCPCEEVGATQPFSPCYPPKPTVPPYSADGFTLAAQVSLPVMYVDDTGQTHM